MKMKVVPQAYKKLKSLGEDVMAKLDSKLLSGETGLDVAKWIKEDLKLLPKDDIYSLKKCLERYRRSELRNKTIERIANVQAGDGITTIQRRFNAMEELTELSLQQRARVDKMIMREAAMPGGILLKDTSREIALMKDLLVDLGRVQLETGLLQRASKSIKGTITDPDGTVKKFEWSEEQEELYQTLEELRGADAG